MNIKEIDDMPTFVHDIDPSTWSRIPVEQQPLAETISLLRQEVRWVARVTIVAHNLAVQTEHKMVQVGLFVGITLGGWGLVEIAKAIFHKP